MHLLQLNATGKSGSTGEYQIAKALNEKRLSRNGKGIYQWIGKCF